MPTEACSTMNVVYLEAEEKEEKRGEEEIGAGGAGHG